MKCDYVIRSDSVSGIYLEWFNGLDNKPSIESLNASLGEGWCYDGKTKTRKCRSKKVIDYLLFLKSERSYSIERFKEILSKFDRDGITVRDFDSILKRDKNGKISTVDNFDEKYQNIVKKK